MSTTGPNRRVERIVPAVATSDGAGVRLKRSIGTRGLDYLDPFLLLDEFRSDRPDDYIAGFPPHPHRGFETVTYMLAGEMQHRDHKGNEGNLTAGSVQWMTAGRGIVHSEMPKQQDGLMWGFQLWVNLPRAAQMCEPRYQDIPPEAVPVVGDDDGTRVKVLVGEVFGQRGPVQGIATDPLYLDVELAPDAELAVPVARGHTAFAYPFDGSGLIGITSDDAGISVEPSSVVLLGAGDQLLARAGPAGLRFLVLAARPLHEPMVRSGPFVLSTQEELIQAFKDHRDGVLAS